MEMRKREERESSSVMWWWLWWWGDSVEAQREREREIKWREGERDDEGE